MRGRSAAAGLLLSAFLLAGCATASRGPNARAATAPNGDPLESLNRKTFACNQLLDAILIKPLAEGYREFVPKPGQEMLRHFLDNLNEPIVLANCLLQGRMTDAGITTGRFVVNSTVGLAGLADVATRWKLPKQVGDFGQTLWSWKVPGGPYLILPVLGPSNPRDGVGMGVDIYVDPFRYVARRNNYPTAVTLSRMAADGIDKRAQNIDALDEIKKESIDYYAAFRSLYLQNRDAELRGNHATQALPSNDFYDQPDK